MVEQKKASKKAAPSIFVIMARKYHLDPDKFLQTIKNTIMRPSKNGREATMEEVAAFLMVANKYDLDPFIGEIAAFPSKRGGIIPVIGVDAYVRKICNHTEFNGMEITFSEDEVTPEGGKQCPEWCEVKLYRKGVERPIVVREYLDEVYVKTDYASPWKTHTKRMLRHKTIIQAGRVAGFLTGLKDEDEAQRIIEAETEISTKPDVEMPVAIIDQGGQAEEEINTEPPEEEITTSNASTPAQQKAIHTLAGKLYKRQDFYDMLGRDYGAEGTKDLSKQQASELLDKLSKALNGKK